ERSECVIDGAGLVSAVHHAIGAFGIAALSSVVLPFRVTNQFLECVSVPVLQKVAGLLPAKDVVGWHAPGGAAIFAPAHQELEKQRTHIELPLLIAITENLTEQATCFLSTEEMFLEIGRASCRECGWSLW